jgi:hypothetical protein
MSTLFVAHYEPNKLIHIHLKINNGNLNKNFGALINQAQINHHIDANKF